jgi:hypothetical protein
VSTLSIRRRLPLSCATRAAAYITILLIVNTFFVKTLFFVDFTDNMQTNAGSFMAISRFILQHWPHLDWFPWWFNGEPFENSYTPMLHLMDAAFVWITGSSLGRAFNFVTASFYVAGPVLLFLSVWRVSRFLETSFFAALLYSLFSPVNLFHRFRADSGGLWNPWRLRTLVYYAEGPHNAVLSLLPLVLLAVYLALSTRKYLWCAIAAFSMAFMILVSTFAVTELVIGCSCLLAVTERKDISKAALLLGGIAIGAYVWASPFLPPTLLRTISINSQRVEGNLTFAKEFPAQCLLLAGFFGLWHATRMRRSFTRFCLLFAYVFSAITALTLIANLSALPQPHRYSLEMELGVCLVAALGLRGLLLRLPTSMRVLVAILIAAGAVHQIVAYRSYATRIIQKLDVTQTIEYRTAKWLEGNMSGRKVFVSGEMGTWLDAFADIPQMHAGHEPFDPNFDALESAVYVILTGENTGKRDAEISILWLEAYGCQAVLVGPSRYYGSPFTHPEKFNGVLPVAWHEGDDTLYAIPQRTSSLAHVVKADSIVKHLPVNGLDTGEAARYVEALDDLSLPVAEMNWRAPNRARIETLLHPGQVLSVQSTYDKGWRAFGNGQPAQVTRDGLGLTVIHPACDGPCTVDFVFDGGWERRICRVLSWGVMISAILAGFVVYRSGMRDREPSGKRGTTAE